METGTLKDKEIDVENNTIEVTFMEEKSNKVKAYRWPKIPDELEMEVNDVICRIDEPIPTGKSKRLFKLKESDIEMVHMCLNHKCHAD